jgi:putative transcriptional regulator
VSKIIKSLRSDMARLLATGAISKVTMREFDVICPPSVRQFAAADIKRLREALKFSQPVFALHLHTTASTVRKWEQGETHPTGPALKLLNVIADKGLQAIL